MKKKTTTEKYIEKAVKEAKKELAGNTIQNCTFNGPTVKLDKSAIEAIVREIDAIECNADALERTAEACLENAKALNKMASLFLNSDIRIDAMVKIG